MEEKKKGTEKRKILTPEEYLRRGREQGKETGVEVVGPDHPFAKKVNKMHQGIELWNPLEK